MTTVTECDLLKPGDTFPYRGLTITVVRGPEPYVDLFGRTIRAVWCTAEGGREGWMPFGPGGLFIDYGDDDAR